MCACECVMVCKCVEIQPDSVLESHLTNSAFMSELSSLARLSNMFVRVSGISCLPASLIRSCRSSPGAVSRTPPRKTNKQTNKQKVKTYFTKTSGHLD